LINLVSPDVREMEEKKLRFFSSISRTSGETRFILFLEKFGTPHKFTHIRYEMLDDLPTEA